VFNNAIVISSKLGLFDELRTIKISNPCGGEFSIPFQTGPGAYPAFCTMGIESFLGINRQRRGVDHPPHLAPRLKKEYSYTCIPPLGLRGLL
jgi:hypothetical protein